MQNEILRQVLRKKDFKFGTTISSVFGFKALKKCYSTRQKKRDTLKKLFFLTACRRLDFRLNLLIFHTALVYDMQFGPKI